MNILPGEILAKIGSYLTVEDVENCRRAFAALTPDLDLANLAHYARPSDGWYLRGRIATQRSGHSTKVPPDPETYENHILYNPIDDDFLFRSLRQLIVHTPSWNSNFWLFLVPHAFSLETLVFEIDMVRDSFYPDDFDMSIFSRLKQLDITIRSICRKAIDKYVYDMTTFYMIPALERVRWCVTRSMIWVNALILFSHPTVKRISIGMGMIENTMVSEYGPNIEEIIISYVPQDENFLFALPTFHEVSMALQCNLINLNRLPTTLKKLVLASSRISLPDLNAALVDVLPGTILMIFGETLLINEEIEFRGSQWHLESLEGLKEGIQVELLHTIIPIRPWKTALDKFYRHSDLKAKINCHEFVPIPENVRDLIRRRDNRDSEMFRRSRRERKVEKKERKRAKKLEKLRQKRRKVNHQLLGRPIERNSFYSAYSDPIQFHRCCHCCCSHWENIFPASFEPRDFVEPIQDLSDSDSDFISEEESENSLFEEYLDVPSKYHFIRESDECMCCKICGFCDDHRPKEEEFEDIQLFESTAIQPLLDDISIL